MTVSWGERWRSVLGGPDHELVRRVRQGRATNRSGRVSDVRLAAGRVSARVQGSRATPFLVEVEIPLLSDEDWDVVIDLLAGKVRYRARLLAGHEPEGLAEEAEAAGVRLFPTMDEIAVAAGHSGESPFPVVGAGVWEAVTGSRYDLEVGVGSEDHHVGGVRGALDHAGGCSTEHGSHAGAGGVSQLDRGGGGGGQGLEDFLVGQLCVLNAQLAQPV